VPTPPLAITGMRHRIGDGARQRQVEADLGAVAVHAGQQDLAGAQASIWRAHSMASSPVFLRPPWVKTSQRRAPVGLLGVDGHHDALRADLAEASGPPAGCAPRRC
jgi:hypothetical protein